MKILVADDSRTMRASLRASLEPWGHTIVEAENGRQALDILLANDGPHLGIVDWLMPELDGPEVCRLVREAGLAIQPYLILLTAKDSKEDIIVGLGNGANDFLSKPFHEGELRARLAVGAWVIQLQTRLQEVSATDPLTGIRNRRSFLNQIQHDVALVDRLHSGENLRKDPSNRDLVFFMVDLDHFKQVNDRYGHQAGDHVLNQTVNRLQQITRASDTLVRWGGEEFLVVARQTRSGDAAAFAERIRSIMASTPFVLETGESLTRTCSIGFAPYPLAPGNPRDPSWETVVDVADQALYAAKRCGRNTWVGVERSDSADANTPVPAEVSIPGLVERGYVRVVWAGGDPGSIVWTTAS